MKINKSDLRVFKIIDENPDLKVELLSENDIEEMNEIDTLRRIVVDIETPPICLYSST